VTPTLAFLALAAPLLTLAAMRDVATRLIPDAIPVAIAMIGLGCRLFEGWQSAAWSLGLGVALFLALVPLAARGWLGGGDVKLIAAMAVGLPPIHTWDFVVATVLVGGLLGVLYILGRRLVPRTRVAAGESLPRRVLAVEAWRIRRRGPLPYAVAICAGAILLLFSLPRA
jgi:prepilin peptidase CpaA